MVILKHYHIEKTHPVVKSAACATASFKESHAGVVFLVSSTFCPESGQFFNIQAGAGGNSAHPLHYVEDQSFRFKYWRYFPGYMESDFHQVIFWCRRSGIVRRLYRSRLY